MTKMKKFFYLNNDIFNIVTAVQLGLVSREVAVVTFFRYMNKAYKHSRQVFCKEKKK